MQSSSQRAIPIVQLDDWSLTIAVHSPETAKRLAGMLIEAASLRDKEIRKQKELADGLAKARGNNARSA